MPVITIKSITGADLYKGRFTDIRSALEAAVTAGTDLSGADLRHACLANAMLDGGVFVRARLDHANLTGANLSEADMRHATFAGASLQGACLCGSDLRHVDFIASQFSGTDIADADIRGAIFSGASAFTLNFRDARAMSGCLYMNEIQARTARFSRPPVAIAGFPTEIVILDDAIQVGARLLPFFEGGMAPAQTGG